MAEARIRRVGHARGGSFGLAVLILVGGVTAFAGQAENKTARLGAATGQPVSTAQTGRGVDVPASIAVLAFANITGDPADDWMGAGIAETVSVALEGGELAALWEEGLSVSERLPNWVVSGAYQRMGDRLRITARITRQDNTNVLQSVIVA